jgi:hypothetical protein
VFPIICPKRWNSNRKMMWRWPYSGHHYIKFTLAVGFFGKDNDEREDDARAEAAQILSRFEEHRFSLRRGF